MVDSVSCLRYAAFPVPPIILLTDMVSRCRLLAAHGLRSCLSVRTQPLTATGAPSQTSTIPYHTIPPCTSGQCSVTCLYHALPALCLASACAMLHHTWMCLCASASDSASVSPVTSAALHLNMPCKHLYQSPPSDNNSTLFGDATLGQGSFGT